MTKYRVTMTRDGATDSVIVYVDKSNAKVAYDDAMAGAVLIFGSPSLGKFHVINIVEIEV